MLPAGRSSKSITYLISYANCFLRHPCGPVDEYRYNGYFAWSQITKPENHNQNCNQISIFILPHSIWLNYINREATISIDWISPSKSAWTVHDSIAMQYASHPTQKSDTSSSTRWIFNTHKCQVLS